MADGTIQNLIDALEQAFAKLNAEVSGRDIEEMAIIIHRGLSVETRVFHTLEHVLSLSDPNAPIRSLAAVFHDLIYYQVDQGFPASVYAVIAPYVQETDNGDLIVEATPDVDRAFEILRNLFAISPGRVISSAPGVNEFLSALVAWKKLEYHLSETLLLKIAVHIEATIPFRGKDEHNVGYFDALAARMKSIGLNYGIPLLDGEIDETIQSAAAFANQDVSGFAHPDPAVFLDNTWKLLPEVNAELRSGKIYSIRDYRQALQKMEAFFAWLEPQNIFHSYKNVPGERDLRQMTATAQRNIDTARAYLKLKLLAIAVLEALAEISGGDTPLALFMGDIQTDGEGQQRLENYLPGVAVPLSPKLNSTVYNLLANGRSGQSLFDLQTAPLALYLYQCLGGAGCKVLLSVAQEMFAGSRLPEKFLAAIDPSVLSTVARACAQMVPTRRNLLNKFADAMS